MTQQQIRFSKETFRIRVACQQSFHLFAHPGRSGALAFKEGITRPGSDAVEGDVHG